MASVHLEKGGEAGKWKEGGIPETPRTKPSKCLGSSTRTAPPGAATPSGGLCSRRFSLSAQSGAGRPGLRGVAYGPSLLLVLRPVACLVLAAAATTSAAASLLLGQQALPLGFVV